MAEPEIIDPENVTEMFSTFDETLLIGVRGHDAFLFRSPGLDAESTLELLAVVKAEFLNG